MTTEALGGILVLEADRDISDYKTKFLIELLHCYCTDEPKAKILTGRDQIQAKLDAAIKKVNELGGDCYKRIVIARLAEVSLADSDLMDEEGGNIPTIAARLELSEKTAYAILIGVANAIGFQASVELNRVADQMKRSLQAGLGWSDDQLRAVSPQL